jgi:hypothetical protein
MKDAAAMRTIRVELELRVIIMHAAFLDKSPQELQDALRLGHGRRVVTCFLVRVDA